MTMADPRAQHLTALVKRVLHDATSGNFGDADLARMHHVGFADLSKLGRMTAVQVDDCARWAKRVLELNPEYSHLPAIHLEVELRFTFFGSFCFVLFAFCFQIWPRYGPGHMSDVGRRGDPRRIERRSEADRGQVYLHVDGTQDGTRGS